MRHRAHDQSVEQLRPMPSFERVLATSLGRVLTVLSGIAILGALTTSDNLQGGERWGLIWLSAGAICVCCYLLRHMLCSLYQWLCSSLIRVFILFGILSLIQIVVFVGIAGAMAYDAGEIFNGVFAEDKSWISFYLSVWQNNIPLYVFEHALASVFGLSGGIWSVRFFAVLCCLSYDIGFLFLAMGMNRLYGRKVAVATGLLSFVLLGLTNQMYQFYTTALSWPFTCLGIYLYIRLRFSDTGKGRLAECLALGATIVFGYIVRPSSIIYGIALVLIEILRARKSLSGDIRSRWKQIVAMILALICGMAMATGVYSAVRNINTSDLHMDESRNATMAQYLAYGITGDGAGTEEVRERIANTANAAERKQVSMEIWKDQLKKLGPAGYLNFLVKKHVQNTNDGSYRITIPHMEEKYSNNPVKHLLQDFWYSNGRYVHVTMFAMQAIYLLFLGSLAFGVIAHRDCFSTFLMLSLIGWYAFLLLFEGARTGYTIQAFPVMIPLAVLGLQRIFRSCGNRIHHAEG